MKKILLFLFALLTIAFIALVVFLNKIALKTPHHYLKGKLTIQSDINPSFLIGNFQLMVDAEKGQVQLLKRNKKQIVWENIAGRAFVLAAKGEEEVKEKSGLFWWTDQIIGEWKHQQLTRVTASDSIIRLDGTLDHDSGGVNYQLDFILVNEGQVDVALTFDKNKVNRAYLHYQANSEESIYGLGAQFSHFDFKGKTVPIFISEQGVGRGDQPFRLSPIVNLAARATGNEFSTYAGVPFYISTQHYGLALDNYEQTIFDFSKSDEIQIQNFSNEIKGRLYTGNPLKIVEQYTANIGRMTGLPDWTQDGLILGLQGGTEQALKKYQNLKNKGTKIAAVWIQDWVGQRKTSFGKQLWWNWELDEERYPNWAQFKQTLKQDSVRILGYINPFLVNFDAPDIEPAKRNSVKRHLFKEAKQKGFLIKDEAGEPFPIQNTSFHAGMLDLTQPKCRTWIKEVIKTQLIAVGLDGWMADYAETMPYDAHLALANPQQFHNQYPEVWAQVNREAIVEAGKEGELFFFSRSGYTRSPKTTTMFWLGDQMVNWGKHDGIKSAVTGMLTSGLSGMSINHSDIGGYTTLKSGPLSETRSEELLIRWIELSAFSPMMRTHEGNRPDLNVQVFNSEKAGKALAYFSKLFYALKSYRQQLIAEYQANGTPICLHPALLEPDNEVFNSYTYQAFFFGADIYVAPIVDKGVRQQKVTLPKGSWEHLWTGKEYKGQQNIKIDGALGQPPVFVRTGTEVARNLKAFVRQHGIIADAI